MIFLIRHADAISDEVNPVRPLSPRGHDQVDRVCEILSKNDSFAPVEFWHSPLARSRETATLLAKGLKLDVPILLKPGLEPDDDPSGVAALLRAEMRDIAVVGHEPHLGVLASMLVHGPKRGGVFYPFSKAGVLALSGGDKGWRAQWLVRSP